MGTQFFGCLLILRSPYFSNLKMHCEVDLENAVDLTDEYMVKEKAVVEIIGDVVEAKGKPSLQTRLRALSKSLKDIQTIW
jgi:hypothetical protein